MKYIRVKKLLFISLILCGLGLIYVAGPRFKKPMMSKELPEINIDPYNVENYVDSIESGLKLRPDNQARIVWYNGAINHKTEYSLLYLHGFGTCWFEGYPTNLDFAKSIGANLYLSRLASHGIETSEQLIDMYPDALYESAKEALLIAKALGNKVIVMGTSTGGTLALKLASDFPGLVHSLVLLSPNVAINNPAAFLLSGPWGLQIARLSGGGGLYRNIEPGNETEQKYWYKKQRWESTVYLQQLINATMTKEVFKKVTQPVFMGYYYKNEDEQDRTVKISTMLEMFDQLGTPFPLKEKVAFPNAGDHVIGCSEFSKSYLELGKAVLEFASKIGASQNR